MTNFSANPPAGSLVASLAAPFGDRSASRVDWLARCAVLFYVLVLPFSHNAALKSIGLAAMLVALALSLFDRRQRIDLRSPVLAPVFAVLGLALVSSLAGNSTADDLDAYRKQFLPLLVLLPLVLVHFRRREAMVLLLAVMAAAFGVRSLLALFDMATTTREEGLFFKGYAMEAVLYTAMTAGLATVAAGRLRLLAGTVLLLAAAATVVNESRTAAVAIALGCLVIPALLGRWRQFGLFLAVFAVIAAAVLATKPELAQRYKSTFDASSYTGPTGMSTRYSIWIGVWQIANERPLLGHGFGWKKLGATAVKEGFVKRWNASGDPYLQVAGWYFALPTDKVNPHNLALQVLFETGFVGLAAYAAMLALLFWQAAALALRGPREWRPLAATVAGFLVSYVVMNVSNGLWIGAGPSAMLIALLETCRRAAKGASC